MHHSHVWKARIQGPARWGELDRKMPAMSSALDGMPMTAGGIPFMCYKVQRIARLAQPAPEGGQPLLLSLPPGPPAGGLSLNDATEGQAGGSAAYYGVWPSCSPAEALCLDMLRPSEKRFRQGTGHRFL